MIHDPPVLILDEPTDGLDPNQKYEVRQLINSIARDKCIIVSTHILEEVEAVCTRSIIIARGIVGPMSQSVAFAKAVADGNLMALFRDNRHSNTPHHEPLSPAAACSSQPPPSC